ncbi:MAG: hypothetical protein ACKVZJ_10420 [Phycisphaerales bacterium]
MTTITSAITRSTIALWVFGVVAPAALAQTADLRWRPQPGQSVRYELHQTSKNHRVDTPASSPKGKNKPAETKTVESTMDQTLTLRFDVVTPEKGAAGRGAEETTVRMTIERVRMKIESEAVRTEIDSDAAGGSGGGGKAADPIAEALRAMAGTTLTLTVDAQGRITKSEGGGGALGLASLLGSLDPGAAARLPTDALGLITPGEAPPAKARVGQRWTSTSSLGGSLLGDVAVTTTHALKRLRAGIAEVETQGSMEPKRQSNRAGDETLSPFRVISASNKGDYRWDIDSGWLESLTTAQTLRLEGSLIGEQRVMESTAETRLKRLENAGEQAPNRAPRR